MSSSAGNTMQQIATDAKLREDLVAALEAIQSLPSQLRDLQKSQRELEELKKEAEATKKFETDFLLACDVAFKKIIENVEKTPADSLEKFKVFQKKCAEFLSEIKGNAEAMLALAKEHQADISYRIMNGPKKTQENCKIILDIHALLIDTTLTLEWMSKENLDSNCHNHVYFYLVRFTFFTQEVQKAKSNIPKLPAVLAAAVTKVIEKDKAVMYKFYKAYNDHLSAFSNYFHERCKKFIPPEMYEGIQSEKDNYSNPKLLEVNVKYQDSLQKLIKEKRDQFLAILSPLKDLLTDKIPAEKLLKTYLKVFDIMTSSTDLYANELGGENSNLFSRFKAIYALETSLRTIYETLNAKARTTIELLQLEKSAERRAKMVDVVQKVVSEELSHAEIELRDRQKQKEIERARRAQAKEDEAAQMANLLLQKKVQDQKRLQNAIKDKIKGELVLAMKKITKEERSFMEDMFNGIIPHRKIKEELFESLIAKLGLSIRPTNKSSGGSLITIHDETINYHHWHGDSPGTLDQAFIKDFKKALEKLGICKADLTCTPLAVVTTGVGSK